MALNPQGDRETRLGRRWVRRDIPFWYASASPALAEPYFPVAQTPPEILGPPYTLETASTQPISQRIATLAAAISAARPRRS